jgi:hypothetical protein
MMLGMSIKAFTQLHTIISLLGIISGFVVLIGMARSQRLEGWTGVFLASTVLTSVTGFMFPFNELLPSHIFGVISLVVLAVAIVALYIYRLEARWRVVYIVSALLALYLNVFVGVVQSFQKLAPLQPLAPTQSEPPFLVAQLVLLAAFLALGYWLIKTFHPRSWSIA